MAVPSKALPQTEQLRAVQVLRAVAAFLVTIAHASEEAKYFFHFTPLFETDPFGKGVDLFFVISGFIIYYSSTKLFNTPHASKTFIFNRALRVIPLYYIFTSLMVVTLVLFPGGIKEAKFDIGHILSSYLFLPYERYDGRIAPILSLGWTLNYEMLFYTLFSLCLFLRGRWIAICAIGSLLLLALAGIFISPDAPAAFREWTDGIVLEFGMGIGIALAYERWGKLSGGSLPAALAILVAGFLMLYFLNLPEKPLAIPRFLSAGVPALMIVGAAVLLMPAASERQLPGWLVALGDSSYSLYLSHRFVQRPIQMALTHSGFSRMDGIGGVYVFIAVTTAVIAGHVTYLLIEQPLLRRMRRLTLSRKA